MRDVTEPWASEQTLHWTVGVDSAIHGPANASSLPSRNTARSVGFAEVSSGFGSSEGTVEEPIRRARVLDEARSRSKD